MHLLSNPVSGVALLTLLTSTNALPSIQTFRGEKVTSSLYNRDSFLSEVVKPVPRLVNPREYGSNTPERAHPELENWNSYWAPPPASPRSTSKISTFFDSFLNKSQKVLKLTEELVSDYAHLLSPYVVGKEKYVPKLSSFSKSKWWNNGNPEFQIKDDLPNLPSASGFDYGNTPVRGVNIGEWREIRSFAGSTSSSQLTFVPFFFFLLLSWILYAGNWVSRFTWSLFVIRLEEMNPPKRSAVQLRLKIFLPSFLRPFSPSASDRTLDGRCKSYAISIRIFCWEKRSWYKCSNWKIPLSFLDRIGSIDCFEQPRCQCSLPKPYRRRMDWWVPYSHLKEMSRFDLEILFFLYFATLRSVFSRSHSRPVFHSRLGNSCSREAFRYVSLESSLFF